MASIVIEDEAFDDERRETRVQPKAARTRHTGGAFRALRHRNFRLFWIGQMISLIGTWAQNLAQGWLIVLLVDPVAREMLRHGGAAAGGGDAAPWGQCRGGGELLVRLGQLCRRLPDLPVHTAGGCRR